MNKSSYRLVWFIPALVGCPLMVGSTGEDREKQCKTTFWGDVDCKTTFWGDVDSQTSRYLQRRPPLPLLRMKLNLPLFYEVNILVFFAFFATANPSPRQPEATAWNPKMLCSASELLHPAIPSSATSHGTSRSDSAGERSGVWTRSGPFSRCTLWCPRSIHRSTHIHTVLWNPGRTVTGPPPVLAEDPPIGGAEAKALERTAAPRHRAVGVGALGGTARRLGHALGRRRARERAYTVRGTCRGRCGICGPTCGGRW